jgi:hypothetical protein
MPPPRLVRPRKDRLKIDKEAIAQRVVDLFNEDDQAAMDDIEARLQRYAKFRMWTEGKDWPWEDASDAAIPDMMTHSLKVQDTLHNAVMSTRPPINSKATAEVEFRQGKHDRQPPRLPVLRGEQGRAHRGRRRRRLRERRRGDGLHPVGEGGARGARDAHAPADEAGRNPEDILRELPARHLQGQDFQEARSRRLVVASAGRPAEDDVVRRRVLHRGRQIEMDAQKRSVVFDGPRPIVKDYEDILAPVRCANLQIPSPSNPGGAAHVIMVDYPTLDEIKRLEKSGFYDLIDDDDLDKLGVVRMDETTAQLEKQQKDIFQGQQPNSRRPTPRVPGKTPDHKTLTRLTCFDIFDIDGDGVNEDVIFWVIKETKTLLRVRELTQVYPANPPRRPFAEASFIPCAAGASASRSSR